MAKALRVDSVTFLGDEMNVAYTAGETPLPASASGNGLAFASRQDFLTNMRAWEDSISNEQLVFLALSQWVKTDPDMSNTALASNKRSQLDLTGAGVAVKLT